MTVIDLIKEMHDAGMDYRRASLSCGCKFVVVITDERTLTALEPQILDVLEAAEKPEH